MCGIFFWANTHGNVDALLSAKALLSLHHRGPDYQEIVFNDGEKIYTDDSVNTLAAKAKKHAGPIYYVAGHARLSIIDLSPHGNQPMIGPAGEVFCFNGTLYNYIELRKRLHDEGITVASSSDTEVFLNWLCQYGVDQGNEFNGSWAFIFIDGKRGKLTLSRDPYGEKPLYYYKDEENLIVASEIKAIYIALGAIPQRFDPVKLSAFLAYQDWDSTDPSKTIFSDIRKVIPGINLSVVAIQTR
jgi:asparagine synthase (glutamine-hydrolysing)